MKPIRMSIKGLNSFVEEQVIDFESLIEYGLFGVFGPTGSGKSTILDGITIALYGKTSRDSANYINTQCEQMQVVFDFKIKEEYYQVTRTFKRNKQGSINASKPTRLIQMTHEGPLVLEEQTKLVNQKCFEIIGLKFEDFVRTVVLPQGKFSEFIKLKGKDRREMLERLFSLNRYGDDLTRKLQQVMKTERDKQFVLSGELKGFEDISKDLLKEKENKQEDFKKQLNEAMVDLKKQEKLVQQSKVLFEQLTQHQLLSDQAQVLLKNKTNMDDKKLHLKEGRKIISIKPYYDLYKETEKQVKSHSVEQVVLNKQVDQASSALAEKKEQLKIKKEFYENKKLKNQSLYHKIQEGILLLEEQKHHQIEIVLEENQQKSSSEEHVIVTEKLNDLKKNQKTLTETQKLMAEKSLANRTGTDERKVMEEGYLIEVELKHSQDQVKQLLADVEGLTHDKQHETRALETLQKTMDSQKQEVESLKISSTIDRESYLSQHEKLVTIKQQNILNSASHTKLVDETRSLKEELEKEKSILSTLEASYDAYLSSKEQTTIKALQLKLVDDQPCPVCGSHEHHPQPIDIKVIDFDEAQYQQQKVHVESLMIQVDKNQTALSELDLIPQEAVEDKIKVLTVAYERHTQLEKVMNDVVSMEEKKTALKEKLLKVDAELLDKEKKLTEVQQVLSQKLQVLENLQSSLDIVNFTEHRLIQQIKDQTYETAQNELLKTQNALKTLTVTSDQLEKTLSQLNTSLQQHEHVLKNARLSVKGIEDKLTEWFGEERGLADYLTSIQTEEQTLKSRVDQLLESFERSQKVLEEDKKRLHELDILIQEGTERKVKHFENYMTLLKKHSVEEDVLKNFTLTVEALNEMEAEIQNYELEKQAIDIRLADLEKQINGQTLTEETLQEHMMNHDYLQGIHKKINTEVIELEKDIVDLKVKLEDLSDLLNKQEQLEHKMSLLTDLDKLFKGKKFVEFVATYQLRYVAVEASKRLNDITSGKYGLEVDDSGQFMVRDYSYGGVLRDTTTLSGGETFLVSLALALSLSAQIQLKGTAPLELFFLDEGFGTLDENFLEVVMSSLERVHNQYLSIGLISHVESIKNRVPIKLNVLASESGSHGSQVKVERT